MTMRGRKGTQKLLLFSSKRKKKNCRDQSSTFSSNRDQARNRFYFQESQEPKIGSRFPPPFWSCFYYTAFSHHIFISPKTILGEKKAVLMGNHTPKIKQTLMTPGANPEADTVFSFWGEENQGRQKAGVPRYFLFLFLTNNKKKKTRWAVL